MSMKQFKDALKKVWMHGEHVSWPYKTNYMPRSLINVFYDNFQTAIECALEQANVSVGPTCIYRSFDILVKAMMYHNKKENQKLVHTVIELITDLKREDLFNETGSNLIYTIDEAELKGNINSDIESTLVHQLIALLKSYVELLYFRLYDISQEIHGPYSLQQEESRLLVWHYRNLRPIELIPHQLLLPYEQIEFDILYTGGVDVCLDIYNHIYQVGGNLKDHMVSCSIMLDNRLASKQELVKLRNMLIDYIKKLYFFRENLTNEQYTVLSVKNLWYKLKRISDQVNDLEFSLIDMEKDRIITSSKIINYRILDLLF